MHLIIILQRYCLRCTITTPSQSHNKSSLLLHFPPSHHKTKVSTLIAKKQAMALRIKTSHFVFLILSIIYLSSGRVEGFNNGVSSMNALHEDGVDIKYARKLLSYDVVLDYDDPGANPKHDPRGWRGGVGGKA